MIKNRTVQLIFQTAFCTLGILGIIASFGTFNYEFRSDFYVHFTNISNYFCIGVMVTALIETIKKKDDDYVSTHPLMKFMGMLGILLTFLVFNILLAGAAGRDPQANWRIGSLSFHVVLPIMYVVHWVLFYEHKKVKWNYPLLSILFPLAYVIFIFIQAAIMKFDTSILIPNTTTPLIYPYFFLNIETQGIMVVGWIFALLAGFVALGYGFYGVDKVIKSKAE